MIGGNIQAMIQTKNVIENEIGEHEKRWVDAQQIEGFLDLMSGDSNFQSYDAKIQESTHIFVMDFIVLNPTIRPNTARLLIGQDVYDILLIDNPMNLNRQLEIYLRFTGG